MNLLEDSYTLCVPGEGDGDKGDDIRTTFTFVFGDRIEHTIFTHP